MAATANSLVHRAITIGLGQVGSRFDEEPDRQTNWSHTGAYLAAADQFAIVGASDPDAECRAWFAQRCPARCPATKLLTSIEDMTAAVEVDVASIRTPAAGHTAPHIAAVILDLPARDKLLTKKHSDQTAAFSPAWAANAAV